MPRRSRRMPPPARPGARFETGAVVENRAGRAWHVRYLTGATSAKSYTCPMCHRLIDPGTAHVVAWPVEKALLSESAVDERRHWHRDCWRRHR